jgi:hypothetical protein
MLVGSPRVFPPDPVKYGGREFTVNSEGPAGGEDHVHWRVVSS